MFDAGSIVQHFGLDFSDLEDAAMHLLMILLEWLAHRLGPGRIAEKLLQLPGILELYDFERFPQRLDAGQVGRKPWKTSHWRRNSRTKWLRR